jgi:hypothetical protein
MDSIMYVYVYACMYVCRLQRANESSHWTRCLWTLTSLVCIGPPMRWCRQPTLKTEYSCMDSWWKVGPICLVRFHLTIYIHTYIHTYIHAFIYIHTFCRCSLDGRRRKFGPRLYGKIDIILYIVIYTYSHAYIHTYIQVGSTACAGHLTESKLKQLLTPMPVMYVKVGRPVYCSGWIDHATLTSHVLDVCILGCTSVSGVVTRIGGLSARRS